MLIGVDRYADRSIPDLTFARRDAEALRDLVLASPLIDAVDVETILDEEATRSRILRAIGLDLPARISDQDIVFIYFAGHGSPEMVDVADRASRFLVCHDSERNNLLATAIDIGVELNRITARIRARLVVVLTDACYSGYSGGRGIIGATLAEHRRSHRPSASLDDLPLGEGLVFIAAASDHEVAWEDRTLSHGVFTHFLIHELQQPWAGGLVGVSSLYDTVYRHVHSFTNGRQNPVMAGRVAGAALPLFDRRSSHE